MAADVGHVLTGHAAIGQGQAMSQSLTATQHLRGGEQVGQQCMAGSPSRSHQHALQAWGTQDPSPTTCPAGMGHAGPQPHNTTCRHGARRTPAPQHDLQAPQHRPAPHKRLQCTHRHRHRQGYTRKPPAPHRVYTHRHRQGYTRKPPRQSAPRHWQSAS